MNPKHFPSVIFFHFFIKFNRKSTLLSYLAHPNHASFCPFLNSNMKEKLEFSWKWCLMLATQTILAKLRKLKMVEDVVSGSYKHVMQNYRKNMIHFLGTWSYQNLHSSLEHTPHGRNTCKRKRDSCVFGKPRPLRFKCECYLCSVHGTACSWKEKEMMAWLFKCLVVDGEGGCCMIQWNGHLLERRAAEDIKP